MSRGIASLYGSRYVSIPYLPPPRWNSTAGGTIRQVLMWIIVLGLGLLGIGHYGNLGLFLHFTYYPFHTCASTDDGSIWAQALHRSSTTD